MSRSYRSGTQDSYSSKYSFRDLPKGSLACSPAIFQVGEKTMWRILLPFVQFAVDCLLALGAFALIGILVCGIWASADYRRNRRHESFVA